MNYWLFKSEPHEYSIDDLRTESQGFGVWDGIRNYQARNILRDRVECGDLVLFYHSSCKHVGVAGTMRVVKEAYADPAQFDETSRYFDPKANHESPKWFCVDVVFETKFEHLVALKDIKANPALSEMVLLKQGRLSIQPVSYDQWSEILTMSQSDPIQS